MWTRTTVRFFFVLSVVLVTMSVVATAQSQSSVEGEVTLRHLRTIVLDPGHGGEDPGAIGVAGVAEKDLTLEIAHRLRDELLALDPSLNVLLTREGDTYPTLEERTHLSNMVDADLFVSIHFNAAENPEANGIETFFIAPDGTTPGDLVPGREDTGPAVPDTPVGVGGDVTSIIVDDLVRDGAMREAATFAEIVQSELLASTPAQDRQVRQGRFRVLRGVRAPAVVVELGFLTHASEGMLVIDPKYQTALVRGLLDSIVSFGLHQELVSAELFGPLLDELALDDGHVSGL